MTEVELRDAIHLLVAEELDRRERDWSDENPDGPDADLFGCDGCPADQGNLFDPAEYDAEWPELRRHDMEWLEFSARPDAEMPKALDPFELLDFVNEVRAARNLAPVPDLAVRDVVPESPESCLLAQLLDCDVPAASALELPTLHEATTVAEALGLTTDHEWVHVPDFVQRVAEAFDRGELFPADLTLPRPGQCELPVEPIVTRDPASAPAHD